MTLIALGRQIETIAVKRTLEITNIKANYHVAVERASLKIHFLQDLLSNLAREKRLAEIALCVVKTKPVEIAF